LISSATLANVARANKRNRGGTTDMKIFTKAALAAGGMAVAMGVGFAVGQAQADQPHMQNALNELQAARGELQVASRNKGGHRVNAIRLTDEAIAEVQAGMAVGDGY
jgi:hypothetical protein